jgi:hypothetical protein
MASALLSERRNSEVSSEPTVIVSEPMTINDLPDDVLLKILSYFGPEELCFKVAEVCKRWNVLSRDVTLWNKISYCCYYTCDTGRILKVTFAVMLGFRSKYLL